MRPQRGSGAGVSRWVVVVAAKLGANFSKLLLGMKCRLGTSCRVSDMVSRIGAETQQHALVQRNYRYVRRARFGSFFALSSTTAPAFSHAFLYDSEYSPFGLLGTRVRVEWIASLAPGQPVDFEPGHF